MRVLVDDRLLQMILSWIFPNEMVFVIADVAAEDAVVHLLGS